MIKSITFIAPNDGVEVPPAIIPLVFEEQVLTLYFVSDAVPNRIA